MSDGSYEVLAGVYEWLVRDEMLTPEGSVAAYAGVVGGLAAGARVLDCSAGTGELAVGLALEGFDVVASDASQAMIARTQALAERRRVELEAVRCTWEELGGRGWDEAFDAVFCVGNSLTHAAGAPGRRTALAAMRGVLRDGGLLVVTSRNWERVRAAGGGLRVADRLAERGGERGLVVHHWTIPEGWDEPHGLEIAVAVIDAQGGVTTRGERLTFWAFTHETLGEDLRAAGIAPHESTYAPGGEYYLVTARRAPPG